LQNQSNYSVCCSILFSNALDRPPLLVFGVAPETQEAINILQEHGSNPDLRYLNDMLRWHGDFAVSNAAEIRKRYSFDCLLTAYEILEIASIASYIPTELPQGFRDRARAHLKHPSVMRYYEQHYPLYLAHLFRRRLNGEITIKGNTNGELSHPPFAEFVSLTVAYEGDRSVRCFEWFLDDGFRQGYGLRDLIALLSKPSDLARVLLRPVEEELPLHDAAQGFCRFLRFCETFHSILGRVRSAPELRAAMWFYNLYWFNIIGDRVAQSVKDALSGFLTWQHDGVEQAELRRFVEGAVSTIDELVQPSIGIPLRRAEGNNSSS
jgi:hypothetical protein